MPVIVYVPGTEISPVKSVEYLFYYSQMYPPLTSCPSSPNGFGCAGTPHRSCFASVLVSKLILGYACGFCLFACKHQDVLNLGCSLELSMDIFKHIEKPFLESSGEGPLYLYIFIYNIPVYI